MDLNIFKVSASQFFCWIDKAFICFPILSGSPLISPSTRMWRIRSEGSGPFNSRPMARCRGSLIGQLTHPVDLPSTSVLI